MEESDEDELCDEPEDTHHHNSNSSSQKSVNHIGSDTSKNQDKVASKRKSNSRNVSKSDKHPKERSQSLSMKTTLV